MDAPTLLMELKERARIVGDDSEDAGLVLMLSAAAGDIAHAAGLSALPDPLPNDLALAIIDQAVALYDQRGGDEGKPGLTLAASRIVSRYRGVSLGAADVV